MSCNSSEDLVSLVIVGRGVINAGVPLEGVTDGFGTSDATVDRFRVELSRQNPQVLLLLEGVNDLVGFAHDRSRWRR